MRIPHPEETIAALASAPGCAARGIIRISGPNAAEIANSIATLIAPDFGSRSSASVAHAIPVSLSVDGFSTPIPCDRYRWPNGRSYTGEPIVELHLPGSPPLLEAVLESLIARGARLAEPGEFTLRAFLNGRLDLLQAEAVLGVIDARWPHELRDALRQLAGGISTRLSHLRANLLELLSDLEAGLDFVDEDIEFVNHEMLVARFRAAMLELDSLSSHVESRHSEHERPRVVLAGRTNVGKSTLFNALVTHSQREITTGKEPTVRTTALVADEPGTTRDYLAADVTFRGVDLRLIDTAGWDESTTGIDAMAQQHRREQWESADLALVCVPANEPRESFEPLGTHFESEFLRSIRVTTKIDLDSERDNAASSHSVSLGVSAKTGAGLDQLVDAIVSAITDCPAHRREFVGMSAARCRESLVGATAALERALDIAARESDHDLLAMELRGALEEIGRIVGAVHTDDILDRIFSKFCIGK